MKEQIQFDLIEYYIDSFYKNCENIFVEGKQKRELFNIKIWLKQYSTLLSYIKKYPEISVEQISNGEINSNFNTKSWIISQRNLENKGKLKLYRQHLLIMIGVDFNDIKNDDYVIIDSRNESQLEIKSKTKIKSLFRHFSVDKTNKK